MAFNKYRAVGVRGADGKYFPSKGEASRAQALMLEVRAGQKSDLTLHPTVHLFPGITWKLDSSYTEAGTKYWEDFKGVMNRDTALKIALWKYLGPGPLRITKMDRSGRFYTDKEYKPQGVSRLLEDLRCNP